MSAWTFALGPPAPGGGTDWELTAAKGRKVTFRLSGNSEASFTLDGRHGDATKIVELATDLHVLRADQPGVPADRLFRGRIGPTDDDVTANTHRMNVTALDYRALLQRRTLYSDSTLSWSGLEQALIAWNLLQQTQIRPGGNLGITQGVGTSTGVARDRTYEAGDSIGQRVQELSEVIDGFEWDISTPSPTELKLDIWPQRGTDRGVILEFGGLAASIRRTVDPGEYANALRLTGQQPEGGGTEPTPAERAAADIATRPEGRWDRASGTNIVLQDSLNDRADWQLADSQVVRPAYVVKLKAGAWRGPNHIWLGDPVRLVVRSGRLMVDTSLRVQEVAVDIADDGNESVTLSIGRPRPDYRLRASATEQRLSELERR